MIGSVVLATEVNIAPDDERARPTFCQGVPRPLWSSPTFDEMPVAAVLSDVVDVPCEGRLAGRRSGNHTKHSALGQGCGLQSEPEPT